MPSKSKAEQAAMGMALAARKGKMSPSALHGAAKDIYESKMSNKQIGEFAATSTKGLPKKVKK